MESTVTSPLLSSMCSEPTVWLVLMAGTCVASPGVQSVRSRTTRSENSLCVGNQTHLFLPLLFSDHLLLSALPSAHPINEAGGRRMEVEGRKDPACVCVTLLCPLWTCWGDQHVHSLTYHSCWCLTVTIRPKCTPKENFYFF